MKRSETLLYIFSSSQINWYSKGSTFMGVQMSVETRILIWTLVSFSSATQFYTYNMYENHEIFA